MIDIKIDKQKMQALDKFFKKAPRILAQVERSAVGKITTYVKSQVAKEISGRKGGRGTLNVTQKAVKDVTKITRRPTANNPVGKIRITGKAIRLSKFGARKTKKGVTAQVFTTGKRKLYEGAFIIKKEKFKGVFMRIRKKGGARKKTIFRKGKYQFRQLWGPAATDVFKFSPEVEKRLLTDASNRLYKELLSQISRRLEVSTSTVTEAFN